MMITLANNTGSPVAASFATGPPGQPAETASIDELFTYPLGYAVALFSALSAAFHFLVGSPRVSPTTAANSPANATDSAGSNTPCRRP